MHRSRLAALAACPVAAAAAVFLLSSTAYAHVSIDPDEAEQGSYTVLNVKVPNERDNAATVEVELHLDLDHPLSSVMPQEVPGWDVEVTTAKLDEPVEVHGSEITEAVSVVTWTATSGGIEPGTFQQFPLSVGPLPEDTDKLVFDAIQTYDSGEVVRWIEETKEGEAEPEHPAPEIELVAAEDEDSHSEDSGDGSNGDDADGAGSTDSADSADSAAASDGDGDQAADSTDTTARLIGGIGIAVGAAGLATGILVGRRRPSASSTPTPPTAS